MAFSVRPLGSHLVALLVELFHPDCLESAAVVSIHRTPAKVGENEFEPLGR